MKKFLGIISVSYSLLILYVVITNKINNFVSPQLQIYLKLSIIPLFIICIVLILNKNIKFKISDLILLLPFIMIIFSQDGHLTSSFATNRMTNFKINEIEEVEEVEKEYDFSNVDFEVIDSNYTALSNYITFDDKAVNYVGKTIRLKGFIVKDADYLKNGYFAIGKYEITCCTADASYAGFIGKYDTYSLKEDSWYEIEGVI